MMTLESPSTGSPYDGQALTSNEIRLLAINYVDSTIELHTSCHELTEDMEYDAISYVWGHTPASVSVTCNGRLLMITPTALDMLHYIHRYQPKTTTRKIWIDAICINQKDEEEKSTQIPLMRDIYSQAANVVVWMGPSTAETDVFLAKFQDVNERLKDWVAHYPYPTDVDVGDPVKEECHDDEDTFWSGLGQLLNNEWFKRLWTYQEIILPETAILLCGSSCLDFDELFDFMMQGWFTSDYIARTKRPGINTGTAITFHLCSNIRTYRSNNVGYGRAKAMGALDVTSTLFKVRSRHVKEPVDRVWAIVGLLEKKLRDELASDVDYSEKARDSYWNTWIVFAKALIFQSGGLSLLHIPPTLEPRPGDLPTWCPNLFGRSSCRMAINGHWNTEIVETFSSMAWALSEDYSAQMSSERRETIRTVGRFTMTTELHNFLGIYGFVLDTIEEVVEHDKPLDITLGHYDRDSEEHIALYHTAVDLHMKAVDLARRVFYGKSDDITNVPEDFIMALFLDCRVTKDTKNTYHETLPELANWNSKNWLATHQRAQCQHRVTYMRGHTFFSTKGGRIGYAHPGCKPGDQVVTFYGGESLYILRQLNPTEDDIDSTGQASDHVQYMGAAFIPHLMEQHQRDAARIGPDTMFMVH